MFDVGWSEILVIAIVLIVVVGPKDLPRLLRQFGRTTTKLRAMAGDFRRQFDDALREAELDDVKDTLNSVRNINPMNEIRKHLSPLEQAGEEVRAGLEDVMKPKSKPEASAEPAAEEPLKNGAAMLPADGVPETGSVTPEKKARKAKTAPPKAGAKGRTRAARSVAAKSPVRTAPPPKAARSKKVAASAPTTKAGGAKPATKSAAPKTATKTAKKPSVVSKARTATSAKAAAAKKPAARKKTTGSAP